MKRYILYTFPSHLGTPHCFRFKFTAWIASLFSEGVCELKDTKTNKYIAYWS
jgi:hypothetical protein